MTKTIQTKTILTKTIPNKFFWKKVFFFCHGFLSQKLTIHRTAGERRGPAFPQLYDFYLLVNIQKFICKFACEMTITYFSSQRLLLFTTLSNYNLIDWLIDDRMFVCLLDDLILGFCYRNLTRETVGFKLESSIAFALKASGLIIPHFLNNYHIIIDDYYYLQLPHKTSIKIRSFTIIFFFNWYQEKWVIN